jgi:ATP-dependent RNA helicase RhlE
MSFDSLGLSAELLRAISEQGYTRPTPIQSKAIPVILQGRDVLGGAQTGTGKTAAFALPLLERLLSERPRGRDRDPRVLIVAV